MKNILVCGAALAFAQCASAAVVIQALEVGGNVEVTLSGKFDKNALNGKHGDFGGYDGYLASLGAMSFTGNATETYFLDVGGYVPFGAGGFGNWDFSSGDAFTMYTDPVLALKTGYVSNDPLSSFAQENGTTFAALGWTPGQYVNTFTGPNGVSDTVTINIGPIPAPGALALLGVAGLGAARRRR